jgi:nocardicin N-oxygenase
VIDFSEETQCPHLRSVRDYPNTPPRQFAPHPVLSQLRAGEPVSRVRLPFGDDAWLVTRHEDARRVLADPAFSRAAAVYEGLPRSTPRLPRPDSLLFLDPPEHTRLRDQVATAFTHRRVEALRPDIRKLTDRLLDDVAALGAGGEAVDLVPPLCAALPVLVLCEVLGVPAQDRHLIREWSDAFVSAGRLPIEQIIAADASLRSYLRDMIARRRAEPADDLLGRLVVGVDQEQRLSEQELVTLGVNILVAGNETTAGQLANFSYLLLTRPELRRQLAAEPELLPRAVEEMLRCVPIMAGAGFAWVALRDVQLGGVLIRSGDAVLVSEPAANHDPAAFDHPEEMDFRRERNAHLSFGHGVHRCLGAQLARVELQVALGALLARFPEMRLAVGAEDVVWRDGSLAHGVAALPVHLGPEKPRGGAARSEANNSEQREGP